MRPQPHTVVRIGLIFVLFALLTYTRADPDLWGHVLFGRDIVSDGRVPATDPYSFTTDQAWINHEWLAESVMYLAYALAGGPGLVALKSCLVMGMLAGIWLTLSRRRTEGTSRDLLLGLAALGTVPQAIHMRPQLFSLLAFSWLLALLAPGGASFRRQVLAIPILFAVWVNLHGGWLVGGGTLALWTTLTMFRPVPRAEKTMLLAGGALALAATLVNPYGWHMWSFLRDTVGFGRADITDWQPVFRLGTAFVLLWSALALAALAAMSRALKASESGLRSVLVVVALGAGAFFVSRLMAFFAMSIVMLLGSELVITVRNWRGSSDSPGRQPSRFATAAAVVVAGVLIVGGAVTSARNIGCVRMDAADHPEPDVAALALERRLQGRLVVWFDWGQYAIWHLAPSLAVSIDGRRETVYSQDVLRRHLNFYYVPSTRSEFLAFAHPDYIWLPSELPVVPGLREDGWVPLFSSARSVLLARASDDVVSPRSEAGSRCFPGP